MLVGLYCAASAVVAGLAVAPLRGRAIGHAGSYLLLITGVAAFPEMTLPAAGAASPHFVDVILGANFLTLSALTVTDVVTRGRFLARAGLDQLLAIVCAAVMTLATAGAIIIDSMEPRSSPVGHVLSIGLLVACVVHLKWTSLNPQLDRPHNPRAPLPLTAPLSALGAGAALTLLMLLLTRIILDVPGDHPAVPVLAMLVRPVLVALPELAVLGYAFRKQRPDIACAVSFGSVILNLASMASMDLVGVQAATYRLENPGPILAIVLVSTGLLACLGGRLIHEVRDIGG